MPTTTYTSPSISAAALGARTDADGAAVTDYTAEEGRLLATILKPGALKPTNAFVVQPQSTPDMTVRVGSGTAKEDYYVVRGTTAGQGNYLLRLDVTSVNVTIDAADASQARTDEIYLVVRDNAYDLSGRVLPQIAYRKGDLGGANPGPDAAWKAAELLSRIPVAANAFSIATVTDLRAASGFESNLVPDSVLKSTLTTKGDLYVASGPSAPVRVGAGSHGQVLTSESAEAAGVKWRGSKVLLAQVLLGAVASNVNINSIPQTYRHLLLVIRGIQDGSVVTGIRGLFNGDDSFSYDSQFLEGAGTGYNAARILGSSGLEVGVLGPNTNGPSVSECLIPNYTSSVAKLAIARCSFIAATAQIKIWQSAGLWWKGPAAAINSISIAPAGSANFAALTDISLYGIG